MFSQCKTANTDAVADNECNRLGNKLSELQLNFVIEQDTTFVRLDSALNIIDIMLQDCKRHYAGLVSTKLQLLSVKKEYAKALNFIQGLDEKKI